MTEPIDEPPVGDPVPNSQVMLVITSNQMAAAANALTTAGVAFQSYAQFTIDPEVPDTALWLVGIPSPDFPQEWFSRIPMEVYDVQNFGTLTVDNAMNPPACMGCWHAIDDHRSLPYNRIGAAEGDMTSANVALCFADDCMCKTIDPTPEPEPQPEPEPEPEPEAQPEPEPEPAPEPEAQPEPEPIVPGDAAEGVIVPTTEPAEPDVALGPIDSPRRDDVG